MKPAYFAFLLTIAAISAPLFATVQITSVTPAVLSPQPLGTPVHWTVTATDSNPAPLTFQFNVTSPDGVTSMVYDFNVGTYSNGVWTAQFNWATIAAEGVYQVRVVAKDFTSGETQTQSASYQLVGRLNGGQAAVNATANPLVALFSAPACPLGSAMQVTFQQTGSASITGTDWKPCTGTTSMNFYVAGMYPSTTYIMNYQAQTGGGTAIPGPTPLSFTTGPLPANTTFPVLTGNPQQLPNNQQPIVLTSLGYATGQGHFPIATDLAGRIMWYYNPPGITLLTRPLPHETMLSIQTAPGWSTFTDVQQVIREFDLAGNVVHETNAGVVQQELLALGDIYGGPCEAIPHPVPIGAGCMSFFNHELMRMPNGYTAVIATVEKIFPPGTQGSSGSQPLDVQGDIIIVLDTNWQAVWYWDSFNPLGGGNGYLKLPVSRASILGETCTSLTNLCGPVFLLDSSTQPKANQWLHGNSIDYMPSTGSLLLSLRSMDWLIKIDYNNGTGSGDVLWRMGREGDFTFNNINNDPWPWFSAQHDATFANNGAGPLTIFDDGNSRRVDAPLGLGAPPACGAYCTSRGMALTVDETNMVVTPVLSQYLGQNARAYGSAQLLSNGDYFFDAGIVNGQSGYGIDVQPTSGAINGTNIYSIQGPPIYRSYRLSSLYQAVTAMQGGDVAVNLTKTAGDGQSTTVGQPFATPLQVMVTDTNGLPVAGVAVIFTVNAGGSGAGATLSTTPALPVATDSRGIATVPTMTANGVAGTFTVTASANILTSTLSATFTLTNVVATLGDSSATVGSAAGSGSVLLLSNGVWSASSNSSWLQLSAGSTGGTGNGLIRFTYSANPNATPRLGTLTIAGLMFKVVQAGTIYVPITVMNPLVTSGLNQPKGVALDGSGNLYIADSANNAVKKWTASTQQVSTLVSSGLLNPTAVAVDGTGNVYIADTGNQAIEEFNTSSQQLTTLVSGLGSPSGVAVDGSGNVYFSDTTNNAVDEWFAATQQTSVLAGSGLNNPKGVAVDLQGNVFFADSGHQRIKKWVAASGMVNVLVSSGLNAPTGVAVDGQDNVYLADTGNNAIKEWNAGNQQVAVLASTGLSSPSGVAVDAQGNVYVADTANSAVKEFTPAYLALSPSTLIEPALAGTDSLAAQVLPANIPLTAASDQPWLAVTGVAGGVISFSFSLNNTGADRVAHITVLGQLATVTQSGHVPANLNKTAGDGQSATVGQTFGTLLTVTVTDGGGIPLQQVPVTFTVVPGASGATGTFGSTPPMPILTDSNGQATAPVLTANLSGGAFSVTASVNTLSAIFTLTNVVTSSLGASSSIVGNSAGSGTVLLLSNGAWTASSNAPWLQLLPGSSSGTGNALIQFNYSANANAAAQTGTLTIAGLSYTVTQAGTSYAPVMVVNPLVSSGLNHPQGLAVDASGNVYFTDSVNNAIKKWNASTHQVTTLVSSGLNDPSGIAVDSQGNVYFADEKNNAIKKWTAANGVVTTLVPTGIISPVGLALDRQGNVYFADGGHNTVNEWSATTQQFTKLVTSGLNVPAGVAVDAQGNVYFADQKNNAIKEWNASTKLVSTLVSSGLDAPFGVAVDGGENVYFTDTGNNAIKRWSLASGQVTIVASTGLQFPCGVALDGQGNVFIADTFNNAIKEVTPGYLALSATSLTEGTAAGTDSVTAQVLPASIPLAATSDQSWLTVTGIAGGVISFSFTSDTSVDRVAHITVLGQSITVTQTGSLLVSLNKTAGDGQSAPANQAFPTPLQVTVTTQGSPVSGVPVTFSTTAGPTGASGTFVAAPPMPILTDANGNATAPALVGNGIAGAFTATASANGVNINFTLTNLVYKYLGSTSSTVGSSAGSGSVLLLSNGPWTASSNASWLQLSAGSTSGNGNALIQFSYSANPNPGSQTGTLTIAGLTYSVTQAGASFVPVTAVLPLVPSGLSHPQGLAVDALGNVYFADSANNAIKKWSASTQQVTTLVSSGLNVPSGVGLDSHGNVYFADQKNNAIKKWTVSTGVVTSLVSSGLISPVGAAVDSQGSVYFSDAGHNAVDEWSVISRKVNPLVVSSGLNVPGGVAVDATGNVYIADEKNNAIKEWNAVTNVVSTLVSGLSSPYGVAVDGAGNVYFSDTGNNAIKEWSPLSGQVTVLASTGLNLPYGVAVNGQGSVYVADYGNNAIKQIMPGYLALSSTSLMEGVTAGTDSVTAQTLPSSIPLTATSDQSWLTITGASGGVISLSFSTNTGVDRTAHITVFGQQITVTQQGGVPANLTKTAGDNQSTPANQVFSTPLQVNVTNASASPLSGVAVTFTVTSGVTGASGTFNVAPPMPILTDANGNAAAPPLLGNSIPGTFTVTASANGLSATFTLTNLPYNYLGATSATVGSAAGSASVLLLSNGPWSASSNAPWLQIAAGSTSGSGNALIQFNYSANPNSAAQTGTLTIAGLTYTVTQVGTSYVPVTTASPLVSTGLNHPQGVAVDASGNVYFADTANNAIKKWSAINQQVTTLVSSGLNVPSGVGVDSQGNVYFADEKNNAIKKWTAATGVVKTLVSSGLSSPVGVAVDSQGNVYFSNAGHNAIEEWNATTRKVTALVVASGLNIPLGVAVDAAGNVYIADQKSNAIKEWNAATNMLSTLVSGLNSPYGVAVDGAGNVYFSDTANNAIKKWSPASGQVSVLISTGLNLPYGVSADGQGNLYVADYGHNAVNQYTTGYLSLASTSVTEGAAAGTDSVSFQVLPASTVLSATSDQSWLTITGASGGSISYSFLTNTSVSSRTANITVLGQTLTITQSGDMPANINKVAGDMQSTPAGQAFSIPLQVAITDTTGTPVSGVAVTFLVTPGAGGTSGTFSATPPMPILTDANGNAAAPALTANSMPGMFSITASAGTLNVVFGATVN